MANTFDSLFSQRPPLAEAAGFFLRLKTAADEGMGATAPAADASGAQESIFAAPLEQVLQVMTQMVQNEFKTMLAYKVYAQSLRGPEHFAIAEEFEEHAEDELEHADFLLRRLSVLGGGPIQVPNIPPPPPLTDPVEILQAMIEIEQIGIASWRTLLALLGDNPTKYEVEGFLVRELEHIDELWQMLPNELQGETPPSASSPGAASPEPPAGTAQAAVPAAAPAASMGELKTGAAFNTEQGKALAKDVLGKAVKGGEKDHLKSKVLPYLKSSLAAGTFGGLVGAAEKPKKGETRAGNAAKGAAGTAAAGALFHHMVGTPIVVKKTASSHQQIRKEKSWGDPHTPGLVSSTLDEFVKRAFAEAVLETKTTGRVSQDNTSAKAEAKTPDRNQDWDLLMKGASSKEEPEHITKARERAEGRTTARAVQTKDQRGELYGDLAGRLVGTGAGWHAGRALSGKRGASLAQVASAGLGQMLGAQAGRQVGRELDAKHASVLFRSLVKVAFDDRLNMLPQEQAAEQAQEQNEAQFYAQKAQEHAQARQQLEQSLQEATQKAQEQEASISQMQATMQQNSQAATQATTEALLQAVNSNTEAIKQRQLAAQTTQAQQSFKDQLRQMIDAPSSGDPQGQGNPAGAPQGPAGQAPQSQESASTVAPGGEESGAAATQSPESGAQGMPKSQASLGADGRASDGPAAKIAGQLGAIVKGLDQKYNLKHRGVGALAGGALLGGAAALKAHKGADSERAEEKELEDKGDTSYRGSKQLADAKSRRAFAEVLEKHPVASSLAAGASGALVGARTLGPGINSVKKIVSNVKELRELRKGKA